MIVYDLRVFLKEIFSNLAINVFIQKEMIDYFWWSIRIFDLCIPLIYKGE